MTTNLTTALLQREKLNLFNNRVSYIALSLFCGQLARLLAKGIPLETNLRLIAESMTAISKELAGSLERAANRISATGCSPAEAFMPDADFFGPQFMARLDLGLRAGRLHEELYVLEVSFKDAHERRRVVRERVWSLALLHVGALIYLVTLYYYFSEVPA